MSNNYRGYSFGEIALNKGVTYRSASIIAKTDCEFGLLSKKDY